MNKTYILITPAKNEEAYIEKTIRSVTSQSILPKKWVIVSDGSTDRTDEIVHKFAKKYGFIQLICIEGRSRHNFKSKINAFKAGYTQLGDMNYEFIGNLDADVSLEPRYYETILEKFAENPSLGIAGGFITEKHKGQFKNRPSNSERSVAGAIQLFRRACFEAIGGYIPLYKGGEDWAAEIAARWKGWQVQAFPELKVLHHRHVGSAADGNTLRTHVRLGKMDYSLGSHPMFEVLKCIRRVKERPYIIGAFYRMVGYILSYVKKEPRLLPIEVVNYLRKEQIQRLQPSKF